MVGESRIVALPAEVLQQDACIIEEQENHLVLTLRVPKEVIRSNLPLLCALADLSSGRPWSPAADPPPKKKKARSWRSAALFAIGLSVPSPFFAYSVAGYRPPVDIESVTAAKPAFKTGENIEILFRYRRNRVCQTTFDHMIERDADELPVFDLRSYGASSEVSAHGEAMNFRLVLKPAVPLAPGQYTYVGYNHSQCAKGGAYDIAYPNVTFTVVD